MDGKKKRTQSPHDEDGTLDEMLHPDRADSDELGHGGDSTVSNEASPREQPAVAVDRRGEHATASTDQDSGDDES